MTLSVCDYLEPGYETLAADSICFSKEPLLISGLRNRDKDILRTMVRHINVMLALAHLQDSESQV